VAQSSRNAPQAAAADCSQKSALLLGRQVLQTQLVALSQPQQRGVRQAAVHASVVFVARLFLAAALAARRLQRRLRVKAL
jgi:hypothetical protein